MNVSVNISRVRTQGLGKDARGRKLVYGLYASKSWQQYLRGVLKIEEAVRMAFVWPSVPRGVVEEGKSALVAQTGDLL